MVDLSTNNDNVYSPRESQVEFRDNPNIPIVDPSAGTSGNGGADDFRNNVLKALSSTKVDEESYKANNPIAFNRKESGFDQLYNSFKDNGVYDKLGFIPGYDNEDIYAHAIGKGGQFVQALKGIYPLGKMAHEEGWRNEGDFWSGLFTGDLKKAFGLTMDQADLERISKASQEITDSHYIPLTKEQREGSFNIGKFSQGFQQFGFTLGTTAQFLEQSGIEWAAAALTAPETAGGSLVAELANMTRRATKATAAITKMYDVSHAFQKVMKFENAFADVSKLHKAYEAFNDVRKASPLGSFSNFYRFTKEFNMASSEARFERAQSFTDYVQNAEQEYFEKNGIAMSADEKKQIEAQAMSISNANGITNIALLYAMNRINMGNIMRTGLGLSKVIEKEAEDIGGEIIMRSGKPKNAIGKYFAERAEKAAAKKAETAAAKTGEKAAIEGAEATTEKAAAKPAVESTDPFMAKKDIKAFSNEWFRGKGNSIYRWGTDSAWEGVQEVAQNVSSEYWKNYYNEKYSLKSKASNEWNSMLGMGERAISKALAAQNTQQGFETFLSGFIIGVPSVMMNMGIGSAQKKIFSKEYAKKEAAVNKTVDFLNNWAKSPLQFFDRKMEGYINQAEIAEGMKAAVKEGNMYAFKNLQRKAFQEFALTAHRAGKLDATLDYMENAAKELSDEDFKATFGIDSDSVNKKTAHEYVSSLRKQANDFVEVYDNTVRKAPNPYNPKQYKVGTEEHKLEAIKSVVWDNVLSQYAMERHTHQNIITRYKDVLADSQTKLGSQAYTEFFKLTNEDHLNAEIDSLKEQLAIEKVNDVKFTAEQRKQLAGKKDRLEMLEKWKSEIGTRLEGTNTSPVRMDLFTKHMNLIQKQNNLPQLDASDLKDAFTNLTDLYKFNKDERQAIVNLNYLADPENFQKLYDGNFNLISGIHSARLAESKKDLANRERIVQLLQDTAFKQKHPELYKELLEARANGESVHAGDILDAMYDAEFPAETYEESKAKEKVKDSHWVNNLSDIKDALSKLNTKEEKLQWLADNNYLDAFVQDGKSSLYLKTATGRVVVKIKIGNLTIPFYISTGQGKKADVETNKWYVFFGQGENGWFNKTSGKDINEQYGVKVFQDIASVLNEIGSNKDEYKNHEDDKGFMDLKWTGQAEDQLKTVIDFITPIQPGASPDGPKATPEQIEQLKKNIELVKAKVALELGSQPMSESTIETPVLKISSLKDALDAIAAATNIDVLTDILDQLNKSTSLTDKELEDASDAIVAKITILEKLGPNKLSTSDPIFLNEYNKIVDQVTALISKPDITVEEVNDAFKLYNNILNRLGAVDKLEYTNKLKADKNAILETIKTNSQTNETKPILTRISEFVKKSMNFNELLNDVFQALDSVLHPKHKEEVTEHFVKTYQKAIDKRLENLKANLNTTAYSAIVAKLMTLATSTRESLEKSMETFTQKSEELAAKKEGISFAVDYDNYFANSIHRSIILSSKDKLSTIGQKQAIINLVKTGILTQEDVDAGDVLNMIDASGLINIGVARIFTLRLNKAAYNLIKNGNKNDFIDIYTKYQDEQYSGKDYDAAESKQIAINIAEEAIDGKYDSISDLLTSINIPITDEITDEQYKLLGEYTKTIGVMQTTSNLLGTLTSFKNQQDDAINKGEFNKEEFFNNDILSGFSRLLLTDKNDTVTPEEFKEALFEAFDKVNNATTSAEGLKVIKDLSVKVFSIKRVGDGTRLLQSLLSSALETKHILENETKPGEKLDDFKMIDIILSDEPVSLNQTELDQVADFANNKLLNAYKAKLASAVGNEGEKINYNPEKKSIAPQSLGFSVLRQKDAADQRTREDLSLIYNFQDGQTSVKHALTAIIYSEFATDAEKALAKMLLDNTNDTDMISLSYTLNSAGEFDANTGKIVINLEHVGYSTEHASAPIETVILHELIHSKIEQAISDPKSAYSKEIKSLMAAARKAEGASTFYAFQEGMAEDEQLREFVTEAMTNPAFQYLLSKVDYANSKRSVWDKFMDFISKVLTNLGVTADNSVLTEVLSLTSDIIENKGPVEERVMPSEEVLNNIKNAASEESLNEILDDLLSRTKEFSESMLNSLKNSIGAKIKSIKAFSMKAEIKGYTAETINGQTYYYKFENGRLSVKRKNRYALQNVKKPEVIEAIVNKLLNTHAITDLLSPSIIKELEHQMGDSRDPGTYSGGGLPEGPMEETDFPNASQVLISFRYPNKAAWNAMVNDFWKYKKNKMSYAELKDLHGATDVMQYSELANSLERKDIDFLIKQGRIEPYPKNGKVVKRPYLEELVYEGLDEGELFDMFNYLLTGGKLKDSRKDSIKRQINDVLEQVFGTKLSDKTQKKIEYSVSELSFEKDEEDEKDEQPVPEEVSNNDIGVDSTVGSPEFNPSNVVTDFTQVTPNESKEAKNPIALRSTSNDLDGKGEESNSFKQFYNKIRNIINLLSVKKAEDIGDVYIVLDKDSKHLRWDGSEHKEGDIIGYLADANGNPIVYDTAGNQVGTVDRTNLANNKGLNNGQNQIVYFNTFKESTAKNKLNELDQEDLAKLLEAHKAVNNGQPQIGRLRHISQGQMNVGQIVKGKSKDLANTKNGELASQLKQDHVTYTFNKEGELLLVITDATGGVFVTTLHSPKTSKVTVKNQPMSQFLIDLLQTYQEMKLAKDPKANAIFQDMKNFTHKMWYNGKKDNTTGVVMSGLDIDIDKGIGLDGKLLQLFNTSNGLSRNEKNIQNAMSIINNRPINISRDWLNGTKPFRFPIITEDAQTGKKTINFVTADYTVFLHNNLGLTAHITKIPAQEDLKRYNSGIQFTTPSNLLSKNTTSVVSTDELVKDKNAVKDSVTNAINNATPVTPQKTKRRKFNAPSYEEIFEKTCK